MKTIAALTLSLLALASVQTQTLRAENRHSGHHGRSQVRVNIGYHHGPSYGYGYGHRHHGYRPYYGYAPYYGYGAYGYAPPVTYYSSYGSSRPSYAASGLFWGGLTGAIIAGNSHGHNAWRGAALGAGAGLLIGAIADQNAREREENTATLQAAQTAAAAQNTPVAQPAPQNVTTINNYNTPAPTPMSSANGLFGR